MTLAAMTPCKSRHLCSSINDKMNCGSRKKVRASGQLIDGIAHDLNNLLQKHSADLHLIMKQSTSPGDVETRVNYAEGAVKRGTKVANQLLAFGLSQAG